jgi:hypothetical protein
MVRMKEKLTEKIDRIFKREKKASESLSNNDLLSKMSNLSLRGYN